MCILAGIYKEQVQKNIISLLALYSLKNKRQGLIKVPPGYTVVQGQWYYDRAGKCPGLIARDK